ncbi:MAG: hypothetical protein RJP96_08970, partial [Algiphilus sp.]|uniref:hypothetical protein n=1 Tax=Algiphilus sp. TaxID=1872431 RepID=UPI0032EF4D63
MNAFWASENFDAFISSAPLPSQENHAENSNSKRSSFLGAEHFQRDSGLVVPSGFCKSAGTLYPICALSPANFVNLATRFSEQHSPCP